MVRQNQLISVLIHTAKSCSLSPLGKKNLFAKANFIVNLLYSKILHQPAYLFIIVVIRSSIAHSGVTLEPNTGNYSLIFSTCHVHSSRRSPYPLHQTILKG